ncbi:MAG: DUF2922 domain-containing protein [Oscillospiraceae bacterium]|nr:DUF2922 domain-containing protein [Oscillospiraceae bacterium]
MIFVDYYFKLSNGTTKKLTVKDLKENIDATEIFAFSDLLIAKNSTLNLIPIVSLESCVKRTLDEEVLK